MENEEAEGAGGAIDPSNPEVAKLIEAATAGLKAKNDEILGEKKKLQSSMKEMQDKFSGFDGVDPGHVKALIERMNNDEETKLIAEGKIDEVISRRTEALSKDYTSKIDALTNANGEFEAEIKKRDERIKDLVITGGVQRAAAELGIVPSALEDVVFRAKTVFQLDDNGNAIARDADGVIRMGKSGKEPQKVDEWLDTMREKAPHWFPGSSGGGAAGGTGKGQGGAHTITRSQARDHAVYKAAKDAAAKAGAQLQVVDD